MFSEWYRSVTFIVGGIHQIDACEVFIGWHDSNGIFTRYSHKVGKSCSRSNKDAFVAISLKFVDWDGFPNDAVFYKSDSLGFKAFDLVFNDGVGKSEFRYAILQDTSDFMKRFEYCHGISSACHFTSKWKSSWAWTDNGNMGRVSWSVRYRRWFRVFSFVVSGKSFQISDGHSFASGFKVDTVAFTLLFLWAYSAAYRR